MKDEAKIYVINSNLKRRNRNNCIYLQKVSFTRGCLRHAYFTYVQSEIISVIALKNDKCMQKKLLSSHASSYPGHTSMITGKTKWLSVTLVTTVSVSVLLVIVSVTLPSVVGAGGKLTSPGKFSGCLIVTVTTGP